MLNVRSSNNQHQISEIFYSITIQENKDDY